MTAGTTQAIGLNGVTAGYGGTPVLKNISLSIAEGEITAVLGPNGAGKSTLLRVIAGLLRPAGGEAGLYGRDLSGIPAHERARLLAVVPQELYTPMAFTVREIVEMGRAGSLPPWRAPSERDRCAVECAMAYTDVLELGDRPYNELSGGEKQRASVAMALAQEPKIILMDEPTSRLDMNHRLEVMRIVERLNAEKNVTFLITSHDLNLASDFCRRLVLLDRGRVAADGEPAVALREDLLKEVYHCAVRVIREKETGAFLVMPERRPAQGRRESGLRIHVVAGGGCGAELMRSLVLGGHSVSCGVLNQGDTDALAAAALGIETALEKPFSPISRQALECAMALAEKAGAVALCETPFGPGNLANLEILERALRLGKTVLINDRDIETRDHTGSGAAADAMREMLRRGALPWRNVHEAAAALEKPE